ncbi:bZIP transcription factor 1-A-like isoform X1 [Wolffia australiana]
MGSKGEETPSKLQKSSTQEQAPPPSPATVFPDWAAFQAYYNSAGPPVPTGFYHSPVASSPQGHPYVWAPQAGPTKGDGKSTEVKKKTPLTKRNGSLGNLTMITGKSGERDKTSGASTNGVESASGDSGSEASSDGSDANSQSGSDDRHRQRRTSGEGESKNAGTSDHTSSSITAVRCSAIAAPTTALKIGRDYWAGPSADTIGPVRPKLPITLPSTSSAGAHPRSSSAAPSSEIWTQDERELKRQRRKQSNRESARRSRMRKQAEYDELAVRVGSLTGENNRLREELARLRGDCERLSSENASLSEKLDGKPRKEKIGELNDPVVDFG